MHTKWPLHWGDPKPIAYPIDAGHLSPKNDGFEQKHVDPKLEQVPNFLKGFGPPQWPVVALLKYRLVQQ